MLVIFIICVEDDLESINSHAEPRLHSFGDDVLDELFEEALDVGSYSFETHDVSGDLEEDES